MPEAMMHHRQPYVHHPNSPPFSMVSRPAQQHGVKALLRHLRYAVAAMGALGVVPPCRERHRRLLHTSGRCLTRAPQLLLDVSMQREYLMSIGTLPWLTS